MTRTTGLGRTTDYRVEFLTDGTRHEVVTAPDGTKRESLSGKDSSRTMSFADGTTVAASMGPTHSSACSPLSWSRSSRTRQAGYHWRSARRRPQHEPTRSIPLSITQLTRTFSINGRTDTSLYDAAMKSFTDTTAAHRQGTATLTTKVGSRSNNSAGSRRPR